MPMKVTRRNVMRSVVAAAAATGFSRAALAATEVDAASPAFRLDAIMKMRGATDGRICMGYVTGMRYAVIDGSATPMFGLLAATFSRHRKLSDTSYEARALEIAYFTDLATGKLLESWTNPFTNRTVKVPQTRSLMGPVEIKGEGLSPINVARFATLDFGHRFRAPVQIGDDVSITEEIRIRNKAEGAGPRFRYNENTTYTSQLKHLTDPTLATVPTSIAYQSLVGLAPWMGFDGIDGMNMGRGLGRRIAETREFPPYFLELTEKYHADVLDDPSGAIDGKSDKRPG
jgi:hypothetical protein